MKGNDSSRKLLQWRLECLGHSAIEWLAGLLPGPWVFRLGEALGGLMWHLMPLRRRVVLRNLRVAFAGTKDPAEIQRMAKESFRRSGANLISAAFTARLPPEKLGRVIHIENLELLEQALATGKGVVLLLAHMGNWEILSRIVHLFPKGSKTGAFYRPLNNRLLDERILRRRQADGTRMFSKRDPFHQVTGFLREGGIVGILADQRIGMQGEVVSFFGRLTRASPLPSLLARRSKSVVLALSVTTESPGKWKAEFMPVVPPPTTENCMAALEMAMRASPVDVFWLQERWKAYVRRRRPITMWLGSETTHHDKPLRALLWFDGPGMDWRPPAEWIHPEVIYEIAMPMDAALPAWVPPSATIHWLSLDPPAKQLVEIDALTALPLDFVLTHGKPAELIRAGLREGIQVISLPWPKETHHPSPPTPIGI
ncbi:MAG: hypothetical protein Q8Q59_12815 [Luteolibacter sp.]|jgi:KDO2-lipid IV(A) lauroyltransferase|nr:hypothetical protein [Luteolibacter sp.]